MSLSGKDYVINKTATYGQIKICSSAFGRGTDFFYKDNVLQKNGGVHIIQTFLSSERSEEVQIQGRTSLQGKDGSYQLMFLETDLTERFEILLG